MPRDLNNLRASLLSAATSTCWAIRREVGDAILAQLEAGPLQAIQASESAVDPEAHAARIAPATLAAVARREGVVAVVPVDGIIATRQTFMDYIMGYNVVSPAALVNAVEQAMADPAVKAIVVTYNTPGGVTTGVPEAHARLLAMRGRGKPIIAQVIGQCSSAGYWLASAADEVAMTESSVAGSVGAYIPHEDRSGEYEQAGVRKTYVDAPAGGYKTEGNDTGPLTDEARAHVQQIVDDGYDMFVRDVAKGRGVAESVVRGETYGMGRVYTAARCVERGMADRVRSLSDTLAALGAGGPQSAAPAARGGRSLALAEQQARLAGITL